MHAVVTLDCGVLNAALDLVRIHKWQSKVPNVSVNSKHLKLWGATVCAVSEYPDVALRCPER